MEISEVSMISELRMAYKDCIKSGKRIQLAGWLNTVQHVAAGMFPDDEGKRGRFLRLVGWYEPEPKGFGVVDESQKVSTNYVHYCPPGGKSCHSK